MTLTNLRSLTRYFAIGDSTSTDFSDVDTLRHLNSAYQRLVILALSASGDWQPMGNNKQTTSITAATRSYSLPSSLLKINRVDIKYPSGGEYKKATQIDYSKIDSAGLDEYTTPTNHPQFDLKQDKIEIFVSNKTASISAVTSGILIYYEVDITELADAGNEPAEAVVPEPFSRLMALMAASDYCGVNGIQGRLVWLTNEIQKEEARFVEFMANRSTAKKLRISFRKENYGHTDLDGSGARGDYNTINW